MNMLHINEEYTEGDNVTAIELQKNRRLLHFSDGTMEELSDNDSEDISPDITDKSTGMDIDVKALPLGSRVKYHAYYASARLLNAIDYIGEGLASFLGITTPKYVSESQIDSALQEEERNAMWKQDNNNAVNTIITRPPSTVASVYP